MAASSGVQPQRQFVMDQTVDGAESLLLDLRAAANPARRLMRSDQVVPGQEVVQLRFGSSRLAGRAPPVPSHVAQLLVAVRRSYEASRSRSLGSTGLGVLRSCLRNHIIALEPGLSGAGRIWHHHSFGLRLATGHAISAKCRGFSRRRVSRAFRLRVNTHLMAQITLQVLDGADRGRVYEDLPTPVTIGREEGNSLQLNDERVSRFHIKIQEDQDKVVITDLESTNGTKVNGEDIQLRILRFGDIISLGRSVLLFGSREQIASRLAELRGELSPSGTIGSEDQLRSPLAGSLDFELNWSADPDVQSTLHTLQAPDLPERLSPGQAAQLCELLDYLHIRIRDLLNSVAIKPDAEQITLELRQWQNLVDLQARLALYLRAVGQPHEDQ
jgi:pSer/pThr/pTyr-binding forkhead associated (FHA) protein